MSVAVAADFNELVQAIAIRSAVYIGEKGWPFKEEWDGNDFTATHMIARVHGDPAGSLRIRYFGEVAKIERLAVLPLFRQKRYGHKGVAFELVDYSVKFLQRKGVRKIYGHALADLVGFWNKASGGIYAPIDGDSFDCAGKEVIPICGDLPETDDVIHVLNDHQVSVRREGDWDRPGYWEGGEAVPSLCLHGARG
jgi:hypothetical protein